MKTWRLPDENAEISTSGLGAIDPTEGGDASGT
jgi:hypothetical protein